MQQPKRRATFSRPPLPVVPDIGETAGNSVPPIGKCWQIKVSLICGPLASINDNTLELLYLRNGEINSPPLHAICNCRAPYVFQVWRDVRSHAIGELSSPQCRHFNERSDREREEPHYTDVRTKLLRVQHRSSDGGHSQRIYGKNNVAYSMPSMHGIAISSIASFILRHHHHHLLIITLFWRWSRIGRIPFATRRNTGIRFWRFWVTLESLLPSSRWPTSIRPFASDLTFTSSPTRRPMATILR